MSILIDVFLLKNRDNTDQYQLSRLKGSRMVFTDEIPSGKTLNESQVKSLTGGDSINARNPHESHLALNQLILYGALATMVNIEMTQEYGGESILFHLLILS